MDIQYKHTNYEPTSEVLDLVTKRLSNIGQKYLGNKDATARAYVELGRAVGAQQTGDIWRTEINLDTEGELFRAEAVRGKLEDAVDEAVKELARELRRKKRKDEHFIKKGGAIIKSMLRGFGTK